MTRINQILALIEERGPMTVEKIAEKLGISETTANTHIHRFRKHQKGLRVVDFDRTCPTRKARIYGLGDEPDVVYPNPRYTPSRVKNIKYPGLTREEIAEMKRAKEALANIKPFRHWMDVALFGGART
jgi:predicted transcriptional regulator